jgi:hypothetical protein
MLKCELKLMDICPRLPEALAKMITGFKIAPRESMKAVMAELLQLPPMAQCEYQDCLNRTWYVDQYNERRCTSCRSFLYFRTDHEIPWFARTRRPYTQAQEIRLNRKHRRYQHCARRLAFKRKNPHITLPLAESVQRYRYPNPNIAILNTLAIKKRKDDVMEFVMHEQMFGDHTKRYRRYRRV